MYFLYHIFVTFSKNDRYSSYLNQYIVQVIKPAVGDSDTAFSSHLGEFDSLVDTIGNEQSDVGRVSLGAESTLQMLKSRHKCHKYVSTLTHSQDIIASEGIFGGPRNADGYSEKIGNPSFLMNSRDCQVIPPPMSIGSTIKILMEKDVVFTEKQRIKACSKKSDAIRGWSLSDFWEQTSWPRDSSGMGTTRFGLPVRDGSNDNYDKFDDDDDDEFMISEAPYREQGNKGVISVGDDDDEVGEFSSSSTSSSRSSNLKNRAIQNNPYVINIMDIDGMESEIVSTEKDCIMFMSAKFCKTCKTINPAFTRMARINQENNDDNGNSNISFVKAETSGASGKELAKHVSVQAVPAFVFIRDGKILGQASVSKLPSKKIDTALKLFATGADWDYKLLDDDVDQGE
jgi:thiol-disulfide isomerase/thioredoxin